MHRTILAVLLLHSWAAAAAAQCGWDADQLVEGTPRSVAAVLEHGAPPAAAEAVVQLRAWANGCDATAGREAARLLRRALDVRRGDSVLGALYGMALARGPEVQVPGATGFLMRPVHKFSNAEKEATRRLLEATRRTGWREPALELAALGLATRREETLAAAAQALEHVARSARDPEVLALLADVQLARRDHGAARGAGERALAAGTQAGARAVGIALLLSARDPEAGARKYLDGLSSADSLALLRYREDIELLLVPEEREDWAETSPAQRSGWIAKGWEYRASIATLSVAERLVEHFRRLEYALEHHWRTSYRGSPELNGLWLLEETALAPIDDAGLIHVRHGPPDGVRHLNDPDDSRMAWYYRRVEGGRAIFEFVKAGGPGGPARGDYYLADPYTQSCYLDEYAQALRAARDARVWSALSSQQRAGARSAYYGWLADQPGVRGRGASVDFRCNLTVAGDTGSRKFWAGSELRARARHVVLHTETATPRMRRPLDVLLNTYAFRDAGGTQVFGYAVIGAGAIVPSDTSAGSSYALRLFAAVENPQARTVSRTDTVIRLGPRAPFGRADALRAALAIQAAPAPTATVRLRVTNLSDSLQGQIVSTSRAVPDYSGSAPALSDLVIGEPTAGPLRRGSVTIAPIPGHTVVQGATFRAFAEAYNLPADAPVEIGILVSPVSGGNLLERLQELIAKRNALSLRFTERVAREADGVVRIVKEVGGELEPGPYWLELSVKHLQSGETATTRTLITIVERE